MSGAVCKQRVKRGRGVVGSVFEVESYSMAFLTGEEFFFMAQVFGA